MQWWTSPFERRVPLLVVRIQLATCGAFRNFLDWPVVAIAIVLISALIEAALVSA
jgi:hypothetical protein